MSRQKSRKYTKRIKRTLRLRTRKFPFVGFEPITFGEEARSVATVKTTRATVHYLYSILLYKGLGLPALPSVRNDLNTFVTKLLLDIHKYSYLNKQINFFTIN